MIGLQYYRITKWIIYPVCNFVITTSKKLSTQYATANYIIKILRTSNAKRCSPFRFAPLRTKPASAYNLGLCKMLSYAAWKPLRFHRPESPSIEIFINKTTKNIKMWIKPTLNPTPILPTF